MRSLLAAALLAGTALAQPAPQPAAKPALPTPDSLPPAVKLALRVEGVRLKLAVAPVVVIVPDPASYVEAIGRWTLDRRFPVLLDDGRPEAREHIARFVRAFKPEAVVRWSFKGALPNWNAAEPIAIENAVGRAWGLKASGTPIDRAAVRAAWKAVELTPPGVIVAAPDDPAWAAAVALSAGRGEPIFWTTSTRHLDDTMPAAEAAKREAAIEAFCASTGYAWKDLGDDLEAITLCTAWEQTVDDRAAAPAMNNLINSTIATTDRLGRSTVGPRDAARWAWTGQIFGSLTDTAYRAMGALFLTSDQAWIFDSYPSSGAWKNYDGAKAGDALTKAGWKVDLTPGARGSEAEWRHLVQRPVNAGLVLVNTKGNKEFFELSSGKGLTGDVPLLGLPSAVHFIHSWSSQFIGAHGTVGGRWIERGVYLYAGSVAEPGLQAFVPTPQVADLLAHHVPFGVAVRVPDAPVWKITVVGDPLATFGPAAPKAPADLPLDGAVNLADAVKALLKDQKLDEAVPMLLALGRDADLAKLASALTATPDKLTPALARDLLLPCFRAGSPELVLKLAVRIEPKAFFADLTDALWFAAQSKWGGTLGADALNVLRDQARSDQIARDLDELARQWTKERGLKEALAMAEGVRDRQPDAYLKKQADGVVQSLRSRTK